MLLELIADKDIYLAIIKEKWLSAKETYPDFLSEISKETKERNEQYLQAVTSDFQKQLQSFSRIPFGRKKWKHNTLSLIKDILSNESIIDLHSNADNQRIYAFLEEIIDFLHHVREFAPELSFEDIGQAIRNYIVYVMFKEINHISTGYSSAGFGYSMLYPFTDNYIDNSSCSNMDKIEYNQLIRDKIKGNNIHPKSTHQKKTCDLLQAIASDYPRDQDDSIYHLLLMMLDAQEVSIRQQNKEDPLSYEERLDISIYKGGISVLIDRCLVNKELTKEDLIYYLGVGYFLQLADDLQDILEDSQKGYQTIFTVDLCSRQEEALVNKMLHFIYTIMEEYRADNDSFKNFILANCYQLIHTSVIGSKEFFSSEYLKRTERYLPVTYPYFERWRKSMIFSKDIKLQKKHMKLLDSILI